MTVQNNRPTAISHREDAGKMILITGQKHLIRMQEEGIMPENYGGIFSETEYREKSMYHAN